MMVETTVGIVGIVVTIISIIVTVISIIQTAKKHKRQKNPKVRIFLIIRTLIKSEPSLHFLVNQ